MPLHSALLSSHVTRVHRTPDSTGSQVYNALITCLVLELWRMTAVRGIVRIYRTDGPILTIYTSYDVFPTMDAPFGRFVCMPPHSGSNTPKRQFWGRE